MVVNIFRVILFNLLLLIIKKLPDSVHKAIQENKLSRISAIQLLLCPTDKLEEVINGCIKLSEMNGNKL